MEKDLRYPIGECPQPPTLTTAERDAAIDRIAAMPAALRAAIDGLTDPQLDTPYRPDGWTVRQVVHHVPDSHLNAYIRFKLALTEDVPTIRPYEEARWAELEDTQRTPLAVSLQLLETLHQRWVVLLRTLDQSSWKRRLNHPDIGELSLETVAAMYAWHGDHHVAHVTALRQRQGW